MGSHPLSATPRPFSPSASYQGHGLERVRHLPRRGPADAPGVQSEQRGPYGLLHHLPHGTEGVAGLLGMSLLVTSRQSAAAGRRTVQSSRLTIDVGQLATRSHNG